MESDALKTVNYRGGVVRFRIPPDWVEEYEEAGGGTFYRPGDNEGGTLRLETITGAAPKGKTVSVELMAELFAGDSAKYDVLPRPLGERSAMLRYDMPAEDRGRSLMIRVWRIFQALPPNNFRHALFTYTLPSERFNLPESVAEMEFLDREISAVQMASVLAETVPPKKPWWRPW
jgi:hypothetical protein